MKQKKIVWISLLVVVACIAIVLALYFKNLYDGSSKESEREEITLGTYEQDDDRENGAEPIEWIVLEKQEDRMLIISKYGLECRPYYSLYEEVTWESSELRNWLNSNFLTENFTEDEQSMICQVKLENDDNPKYKTEGGPDTEDRIFILSLTEAETYFKSQEARMAEATEYAKEKDAFVSDIYVTSYWWLRTPGNRLTNVAIIGTDGSISVSGDRVDRYNYVVRPAMWINKK